MTCGLGRRTGAAGLTLALLLGGCGGGSSEDSTGASSTSGGPTGQGDGSTSSGDEPTAGEVTSTGPGEASSSSGAASEGTGGEAPGIPGACAAYCGNAAACGLEPDPGECSSLCNEQFEGDRACLAASAAWLHCLGDMTCEEITTLYEQDEPGPCGGALQAHGEACELDTCESEADGAIDGSECSVDLMCPGEPAQRVACDERTCVCIEAGEQVGVCASRGVCATIEGPEQVDAFIEFARDCCGF